MADDLMKKYNINRKNKPKKSSFLSQIENYNFDKVESNINNFKNELNKQNVICAKLGDNTQNIINNCSEFVQNNEQIIKNQLQELKDLDESLKDLIIQNNEKEELNQELNDLVNSDKSVELANEMKEIRNVTESIMSFLEEQNIQGFHN